MSRSSRKLSVKACWILARSSSRAMNMTQAQTMIRQSILRMSWFSSLHVHRARGSNRWMFSLSQQFSFSSLEAMGFFPRLLAHHSGWGSYRSAVSGSSKTLGCFVIRHEMDSWWCSEAHEPAWRWRRDRSLSSVETKTSSPLGEVRATVHLSPGEMWFLQSFHIC